MFIERVKNPDNSDRWYAKRDRITYPTSDIQDKGHTYFDINEFYNKRVLGLSALLQDYNPKYTIREGRSMSSMCIVLLCLHKGLIKELSNLLIELDI